MNKTLTSILLAAALLLTCSCSKDNGAFTGVSGFGDSPVSFSIYTPSGMVSKGSGVVTKGLSYDLAGIGTKGVGVFAFYQKAKSNGYPVDFSHDVARTEPNFMYNQKLEREETEPGIFSWTYSPKKYWPNNPNDQLSFFAYAPYDVATSWDEDMAITCNADGTKISRHYYLYPYVTDQKDLLWTDPILNMVKTDITETIDFEFRHICAKLGVTCKINIDEDNAFVTVDKVVIRARFNTAGDYVYRTSSGTGVWENMERSQQAVDYIQFDSDGTEGHRILTEASRIGDEDSYLFPFPGVQDIIVTAALTQHNGANTISGEVSRTFTAMELEEGKFYNFLLDVNIKPIDIGTVAVADWSLDPVDSIIP